MPTAKKNTMSPKAKVALGVGAVALAAATYYFFGPNGKQHRSKLKGWMIKMKGEIIEKMEQAATMTEAAYHKIVDTVASKYRNAGTDDEVEAFVADLKKHWSAFSKKAKSSARTHASAARKSATKKTSSASS